MPLARGLLGGLVNQESALGTEGASTSACCKAGGGGVQEDFGAKKGVASSPTPFLVVLCL